jgi:hypothetical protein
MIQQLSFALLDLLEIITHRLSSIDVQEDTHRTLILYLGACSESPGIRTFEPSHGELETCPLARTGWFIGFRRSGARRHKQPLFTHKILKTILNKTLLPKSSLVIVYIYGIESSRCQMVAIPSEVFVSGFWCSSFSSKAQVSCLCTISCRYL